MPGFLNRKKSIVSRIIFSYSALMMIIISATGILYFNILHLSGISENMETLGELSNDVLEMRRFEKNYLLYGTDHDFEMNSHYITKTMKILESKRDIFLSILPDSEYSKLKASVLRYRDLMGGIAPGLSVQENELEEIRTIGFRITETAEKSFENERKKQSYYLSSLNFNILMMILVSLFFSTLIGFLLSSSVVTPIRALENGISDIARGNFSKLNISLRDREFESLSNAINRMIEELDQKKEHLVQAQKIESLGLMASGMAHELNNPLSNIYSSCQILTEEIDNPDTDKDFRNKLLTQIREQTERAGEIVRSVLDYGRAGPMKIRNEPAEKVIKETISFLRIADYQNISIITDIQYALNIYVDRKRFCQALLNIISNGMDSMEGRTGQIAVTAYKDADSVFINVTDEGHGMTRENLNRIFNPFFSTKEPGKGTGLGLHIAYEIIKDHGGKLTADSIPGRGTTMSIILPSARE